MSDWQALLRRLTDRLSVDPELQMDVAQELRAHLEDSAAEFRRAGETLDQAADSAVKALGDEQVLAEDLWKANKLRIRLRGVLRWAARVTLIPAAVAVVLIIAASMAGVGPRLEGPLFGGFGLGDHTRTAELTEEQRFILEGSPDARNPIEAAKSISDRWPDNPIYYGNYVATNSERFPGGNDKLKSKRLGELLAICDRGEMLDPDNAHYNFMKAAYLIGSVCELQSDPSRTYSHRNRRGQSSQKECYKVTVHDPEQFERGLAELRRGLLKRECSARTVEMLDHRLDLLPKPSRMADILHRIGMEVSIIIPNLNWYRNLGKTVSARAVALAEAGQAEEAVDLVKSAEAIASVTGAHARTLIELLVAQSMRIDALAHAEQVYKQLGREDEARQAAAARREQAQFLNDIWRKKEDPTWLSQAGMVSSVLTPRIPGYVENLDFEPMRTAEKYVVCEFALLALLAGLILLAGLLGAVVLWRLAVSKRSDRPLLIFVGWRRIGRICLLAVVLPIAILGVYRLVTPSYYGLSCSIGRVLAEYAVAGVSIVMLLLGLSYSAIRRRAEELGLAVPPPVRPRRRMVVLCLGVLAAGFAVWYITNWWASPPTFPIPVAKGLTLGAISAGVATVFLLIWIIRELVQLYSSRSYRRFRQTLWRSLVPILAASVIVVGTLAGWALARGERTAVRRVIGQAAFSLGREVDRTEFRKLRDRFDAQLETLRKAKSTER